MSSNGQTTPTKSNNEVNPLDEWTTAVFGENLVDRIVAAVRGRMPATALFCVEEWVKRSREDMTVLEVEFEDRTGCRFETLLVKIYKLATLCCSSHKLI